ncbi:MAG: hydrogenase maturation nickel metallochaperone HypA [Phycisphaeraceae bacterium]
MHELAITQEVVTMVCASARGVRVRGVRLEIGKLSCVLPDAVRFCFELCAEGTLAEGAKLEIIETPGRVRCRECDETFTVDGPWQPCACGSMNLEWLAGQDLKIKTMEISSCARPADAAVTANPS